MYLLIEADLTVSFYSTCIIYPQTKTEIDKIYTYDGNLKAKMPVNFAVQ